MPLETGTWTINQNGSVGQLTITSVDTAGNVRGTLFGALISGFWNEVSQKLTFISAVPSPPNPAQEASVYTGYLFADQFRIPGIKGGTVFTLAGYVAVFQAAVSAERPTFGWYAQIGVA